MYFELKNQKHHIATTTLSLTPTKNSASATRSRAYWSLRLNAAADGITSAGNHLTMHPAASKSGGGFFFACLPTRRAFESVGRAIAEVAQRPKQGQRAARVGKEKAPRRTLSNKVVLFRNVGSDLNTLIG